MTPFQIMNARMQTIDELLRVDTGREKQRDTVCQAILDSLHNVYIYGSRGSGKTFFQKTQSYYFTQLDFNLLPIYVSVIPNWRSDSDVFVLHILNTIMLECWQKFFNRPKSDLIRLSTTDELSILDDLKSKQKHFIKLYNLINVRQFDSLRKNSLKYGASVIAKAENKHENQKSYSRDKLLPSEVLVILDEVAELISESSINRIVILIDEIELMPISQQENFLSVCMGMFNPIGVQFVVTGVAIDKNIKSDNILNIVETSIELEGLSSSTILGDMIAKYSTGTNYSFEKDSIEILYEFFGGHPRFSLDSCSEAINLNRNPEKPITPQIMTKVCLNLQQRIEEEKILMKNF